MKSPVLIALVHTFLLLSFLFSPKSAIAACDQGDAPDCACFNDAGTWDAGGPSTTDIIQEVALDTVGTQESCSNGIEGDPLEKDTGKPYYSIVLGCNSEACALTNAYVLAYGTEGVLERRQAWCSETIAYWHREAGIPYRYGYGGDDGSLGWLLKSVPAMKSWYESQESGGRGRWIEAEELDYNDFQLGVNAPVPGAYMAWTGCVKNVNTGYVGYYDAAGHSLMIDEMTIHRDGTGRIFQVEATFLEGNSGNRVKNSRHWDDIFVFTPQGSQWVYWAAGDDEIPGTIDDVGVKIYGFGIDLDETGQPIYDKDRLHYKTHIFARAVTFDRWIPEDDAWDNAYAPRIPAMKVLSTKLRENQGPDITCSSDKIKCSKLPNGNDNAWSFPMGISEEISIHIDYLAPNPQPLEGVRMFWDPDFLPQNFKVNLADEKKNVYETTLTEFSNFKPLANSGPIPMMARLERPVTGIRYVSFIFPKGTFTKQSAQLRELILPRFDENWKDAEDVAEDLPVFVDIKPGTCPNTVRPGDSAKMVVALLGSNTISVEKIDPNSIRFNGKDLKLLEKDYNDVAVPFIGSAPGCHTLGSDDQTDLVLFYDLAVFRKTLGLENLGAGQYLPVRVTGRLYEKDGSTSILGQDFVKAPGPHLPFIPLLMDQESKPF